MCRPDYARPASRSTMDYVFFGGRRRERRGRIVGDGWNRLRHTRAEWHRRGGNGRTRNGGAPGISQTISRFTTVNCSSVGNDAHGQTGLWESNGTASGTHELTGIVGASTAEGVGPVLSHSPQWPRVVQRPRFWRPTWVVGDGRQCCGNPRTDRHRWSLDDGKRTIPVRSHSLKWPCVVRWRRLERPHWTVDDRRNSRPERTSSPAWSERRRRGLD